MKTRITLKTLQAVVDRLNVLTNSPLKAYAKDANGKYVAQIGNYSISQAYGGVNLERMVNVYGGISNPWSTGHMPKALLCSLLQAYMSGIDDERDRVIQGDRAKVVQS